MLTVHPVYADLTTAASEAEWPANVWDVRRFLDRQLGRSTQVYNFTVPNTSPLEVQLDAAVPQTSMSVLVDSVAYDVVRGTPASGQVGWDPLTGIVKFANEDSSSPVEVELTPYTTVITSQFLVGLQSQVATMAEEIADHWEALIAPGRPLDVVTAGRTLTAAESGTVFSNSGATGTVQLVTPASGPAGRVLVYTLVKETAQTFQIRDNAVATVITVGNSVTVGMMPNGSLFVISEYIAT